MTLVFGVYGALSKTYLNLLCAKGFFTNCEFVHSFKKVSFNHVFALDPSEEKTSL